jgi:hypothetical protein
MEPHKTLQFVLSDAVGVVACGSFGGVCALEEGLREVHGRVGHDLSSWAPAALF